VLDVTGYGRTSTDQQAFHPFYLQPAQAASPVGFYAVNRLPRTLSENERHFGARSSYAGSEVFLSLVDPSSAPFSPRLEQLAVTALCTNRHLPLTMPKGLGDTDFLLEDHAAVSRVRCLVGPSSPRASFAEGRHAWRAVSMLSLNYLSLTDNKTTSGVLALRELLRLFTNASVSSQRMLDGIVSVESRPSLARSPGGGPVVFIRGMDVDLTLDEDRFAGSGVFTLASVLDQFLARYVTINNYTRLRLLTVQRKEVLSWPPRLGRIPPL
jgi:type VI secretion system protein ImpG